MTPAPGIFCRGGRLPPLRSVKMPPGQQQSRAPSETCIRQQVRSREDQARPDRAAVTPCDFGPDHLVQQPDGQILSVGGGTIQAQVAYLGGTPAQSVQRQALVAQIGRMQGNRHLQRLVAATKSVVKQGMRAGTIARWRGGVVIEGSETEMSRGREGGMTGSEPVGHASGWAYGLTSELVLDLQSQYDERSDIPHDASRCGAAALLGAAIAQGPDGLTNLIDRLQVDVEHTPAGEEGVSPTLVERQERMAELYSRWHHDPGPAWNLSPGYEDALPFTFDDLSWLQAIVFAQNVGADAEEGMSEADVQAAVQSLAGPGPVAPTAPGWYRLPIRPDQMLRFMEHNNREVARRFINEDASARLRPGQSVLLEIAQTSINAEGDWDRGFHAITLSRIGNTFHVYNSERNLLTVDDEILESLPEVFQTLSSQDFSGDHMARAGGENDPETSIFGLTLGLVSRELTAPFQF